MPVSESPASWLTPSLLEKVAGGPVRDFEAKPLGAGDNFASAALRVRLTAADGKVQNLIAKRPLPPEVVDVYYPIRESFDVEGRVYAEILPPVHELLRSVGRDRPPIAPRMVHREPEPEPSLFFEDISFQGFRLADRASSLDADHVRLVMRALARLHAAGSVLLHRQPALFDNLPRMVCEEHDTFVSGMLEKGMARFLRHAEQWPEELCRRTVAKLRRLEPGCKQRLFAAHRPDPQGFNVALHGDLWTGNMLFKYGQDGKPAEVRLIDYQISTWGSPCSDLMYFFPTVSGEVRLRRDDMLAEYHDELSACLRELSAPRVPTLAELQAEMRRRGFVEVMHTMGCTHIIMAPHSVGITFDNIVDLHTGDGPHPRDLALDQDAHKKVAKQFFAAWDREGLLDSLLEQDQ
ncbi:hypothetical protein ONE63_003931 [Megalurothrips usitatus]|uniref:CHK kinase-like domain-containing protein n=1 Tax=Megalurothrips usitatus TaxID=439358 RepID=A0AAV7X8H2_9NEOP|nr:hypothetical protein ONE63_003931 [Megalurothrips usitatus]